MATVSEATQILVALSGGDRSRVNRLMELVYSELRKLANTYLRGGPASVVLQPTELVHEAFVKLVNQDGTDWRGRSHFFAVAALAMRHVLVDEARKRGRSKRGAGQVHVPIKEAFAISTRRDDDVLAVDEVLERLRTLNPDWARLVELRFFGGLTVEEASEVTGTPKRTVERDWAVIRAWLRRELS